MTHALKRTVVLLMKFSSLAVPKFVILTTFDAASYETSIKMMIPPFLWLCCLQYRVIVKRVLTSNKWPLCRLVGISSD